MTEIFILMRHTIKTIDYREYWFINCYWEPLWKLRISKFRHDGHPRLSINIGPLWLNMGRDHDWL